jgi:DNA-binding helix-hairpin-helix protein with protein kinase domain
MSNDIERRELLKIAAATALAARFGAAREQPRFFTTAEFAIVNGLTEIIIPADDHSLGARAAGAAAYIDARLAESLDAEKKDLWRKGVQLVNQASLQLHGKAFLESSPAERMAVVERMAQNEEEPNSPEEMFFTELKRATVHVYYTSKIGIHQEMVYEGNVVLNQFVGTELP